MLTPHDRRPHIDLSGIRNSYHPHAQQVPKDVYSVHLKYLVSELHYQYPKFPNKLMYSVHL